MYCAHVTRQSDDVILLLCAMSMEMQPLKQGCCQCSCTGTGVLNMWCGFEAKRPRPEVEIKARVTVSGTEVARVYLCAPHTEQPSGWVVRSDNGLDNRQRNKT